LSEILIRKAAIEDASLILGFIKELARYEKAEEEVIATVEDIENNLFSSSTTTEALICTSDKTPIGIAIYFLNFSTWLGKNGLYLEDLYVSPNHRGSGAGKGLLKHLAELAVENNYGRFEWSVLDWNEPAIKFYESIGAKAQSEWMGYRLEGESLLDFAKN
jgi:GNAT superfamily N-acetyltransferase